MVGTRKDGLPERPQLVEHGLTVLEVTLDRPRPFVARCGSTPTSPRSPGRFAASDGPESRGHQGATRPTDTADREAWNHRVAGPYVYWIVSRAGTTRERLPLQQREVLFESPEISVVDFRCQAHVEPAGPETRHRTSGIVFVRRGVFRWIRERDEFLADPTSILFFNQSEPCRFAHPVAGGDDCTILTLDTPRALELVARHAPGDAENAEVPFRFAYGACSSRAAWLHCELLARTRQGSPLAIEDVLAELTDEAMRAGCRSQARPPRVESRAGTARRRHRDLTEAAKVLLNERIQSPPSLRELALRLGCSPFHLSRTFHRTVGISLRQYHARLRARIAAQALARGARDLTELALELGYTDHSHFTKAFRGEWGLPPSKFRSGLGSPAEKRPTDSPVSA